MSGGVEDVAQRSAFEAERTRERREEEQEVVAQSRHPPTALQASAAAHGQLRDQKICLATITPAGRACSPPVGSGGQPSKAESPARRAAEPAISS